MGDDYASRIIYLGDEEEELVRIYGNTREMIFAAREKIDATLDTDGVGDSIRDDLICRIYAAMVHTKMRNEDQ